MSVKYKILKRSKAYLKKATNIVEDLRCRCKLTEDAKKRLKSIGGGYHGSNKEYKETVLKYWNRYNVKPERCWFDLLCDGRDIYV